MRHEGRPAGKWRSVNVARRTPVEGDDAGPGRADFPRGPCLKRSVTCGERPSTGTYSIAGK